MRALVLALLCARPAAAAYLAELPRPAAPAVPGWFAAAAAPPILSPALSVPAFAPALAAAPSASAPLPAEPAEPAAAAPAENPAAPANEYRIGSLIADRRAPGALELAKALNAPELLAAKREDGRAFDGNDAKSHAWPLVGIFHVPSARVLNGYSLGAFGVRGHSDALPPNVDRAEHGGYTLFVRPDGRIGFIGSGSVQAEITPAVERAVLRYYGLRPARESTAARLRRLALRAWDELILTFRS